MQAHKEAVFLPQEERGEPQTELQEALSADAALQANQAKPPHCSEEAAGTKTKAPGTGAR